MNKQQTRSNINQFAAELVKIEMGCADNGQQPSSCPTRELEGDMVMVNRVSRIRYNIQKQQQQQHQQQKPQPISNEKITLRILSHGGGGGSSSGDLSLARDIVPKQLFRAGVCKNDWAEIWDSVAMAWAPMLSRGANLDTLSSAHLASSVTVMACNSLALANFLLNSLGVLVQLKMGLERTTDTSLVIPIGLEFVVRTKKSNHTTTQKEVNHHTAHRMERSVASCPTDGRAVDC